MPKFDGNALRSLVLAGVLVGVAGTVALAPQVALAQPAAAVRGLPDFTDLVDQVGPSVVNIRTVEKASSLKSATTPSCATMPRRRSTRPRSQEVG